MKTQMILFDLDGTLLPMDMDVFTGSYFKLLAAKAAPHGYTDSKALIDGVWSGTAAMVKNDGSRTNEEAFWARFAEIFGADRLADRPIFEEFYAVEFQNAQAFCGFNPKAKQAVELAKALGFRVALATNPLFPDTATVSRTRWAGLDVNDFELYTTYENSTHCKPNPEYYRELLKRLDLPAEACLMVGNDAHEDMIAETLGMKVFLLTDCLVNKQSRDISAWPHGDFDTLMDHLRALAREKEEP